MSKIIRKTVTIFLIISLVYANLSGTIFGIISYALENEEELQQEQQVVENIEKLENEAEGEEEKVTKAELGINTEAISTSVENNVNFTITMLTDSENYDLYKNPKFEIELPAEINKVALEDIEILNSNFEVDNDNTKIIKKENGNLAIQVHITGEQTEHTNSTEANAQIVVKTKLETEKLLPTQEKKVILYYTNENATKYRGDEEKGTDTTGIKLVSNSEIIAGLTIVAGDKKISTLDTEEPTITIKPNTCNKATVKGTVINNTNNTIENAKILGTVSTMGQIKGIDGVYYTENENATTDLENNENNWTSEYKPSAKKYLIVIEEFKQGQIVNFEYDKDMPEKVETDTTYAEQFAIYDNDNKLVKTLKATIRQEAEHFNIYEDENIKATIELDKNSVEVGETFISKITIQNKLEEEIKNISLQIKMPTNIKNNLLLASMDNHVIIGENPEDIDIGDDVRIYNSSDYLNIENFNISKGSTLIIQNNFQVEEYVENNIEVKAIVNYQECEASILAKTEVIEPSILEVSITNDKENVKLQDGDEITYKIVLKNIGESHAVVDLNLPEFENMNIVEMQVENKTTGETKSKTGANLNGYMRDIEINPEETVEIRIVGHIKSLENETKIAFYAEITGDNIVNIDTRELENIEQEKLINNVISQEQIKEQQENPEKENPEENPDKEDPGKEDPDKKDADKEKTDTEEQEGNNEKEQSEGKTGTNAIRGIAWVDKNNNGQRDKTEMLLKDIQAILINATTSKELKKTTTNNEGEYKFENLPDGKYIVIFKYNTNIFKTTDYKKDEATEDLNSDAIETTQSGETTAKTEVITLQNGKTQKIDIGLIINKKFDMSISKGITKVTVDNETATNIYNFDSTNMAKVEVNAKYLKGSIILVEYEIAVTNNGEIAGYAKAIKDEIPTGMKFTSELNTNWYEGEDGNLYCMSLANKEIQPGETVKTKLILTKEMTDDKVTSPVNKVSINELFNEYLIDDKDSDNNIAEATLIISIKTGKAYDYMWLILLVVAIIGTGAYGTIKLTKADIKVNNKERRK